MIRWRKVKAVASYEFLSTVKRKGYLILTFGMPVIVGLYALLIMGVGKLAGDKANETKVFGVVDQPQVLRLSGDQAAPLPELPPEAKAALKMSPNAQQVEQALSAGRLVFRPYTDESAARSAADKGEIKGYYLIPADYMKSGEIKTVVVEKEMSMFGSGSRGGFSELLLQRMLADRVDAQIAERVKQPIAKRTALKITASGDLVEIKQYEELAKFLVPFGFGMLMMLSILMTGTALLQATATEKENKVVDVLISSAYPDEILLGKLIGQGAAGLMQIAVWFGMIATVGVLFFASLAALGVAVPWKAVIVAPLFFICGYFFLGSLMVGVGSLGQNMREAQALTWVFNMLPVIPFMLFAAILAEPNGTLARVLTWIPFTAPLTVMLRNASSTVGVPWWELIGSLLVMIVGVWISIKIGGRMFRVGMLLSGARPKFGEIMRQAGFLSVKR